MAMNSAISAITRAGDGNILLLIVLPSRSWVVVSSGVEDRHRARARVRRRRVGIGVVVRAHGPGAEFIDGGGDRVAPSALRVGGDVVNHRRAVGLRVGDL